MIAENPYDAPDSPDSSMGNLQSNPQRGLIHFNFRLNLLSVIISVVDKLILQLLCRSTESATEGLQAIRPGVMVGTSFVSKHHKEPVKCN